MRPVKNKRRIDPRYFLDETVDRDNLDEDKEHDEDCDCSKCPEPKKKKKGKDKNDRELIQGEKELEEDGPPTRQDYLDATPAGTGGAIRPKTNIQKMTPKEKEQEQARAASKGLTPGN
jgi:hypothetical protein